MFLILTSEKEYDNEVSLIKEMLQTPWVTLHVRKPFFSKEELQGWLSKFHDGELRQMMLHQHHCLAEHFPVKGLHFSEKQKQSFASTSKIEDLTTKGFTLSAAFHSAQEAQKQTLFSYGLLSPVFDSISKKNYIGKLFCVQNPKKPVIALGGISPQRIAQTRQSGFGGIAVLGYLWQHSHPLKAFENLKKQYETHYLSHL